MWIRRHPINSLKRWQTLSPFNVLFFSKKLLCPPGLFPNLLFSTHITNWVAPMYINIFSVYPPLSWPRAQLAIKTTLFDIVFYFHFLSLPFFVFAISNLILPVAFTVQWYFCGILSSSLTTGGRNLFSLSSGNVIAAVVVVLVPRLYFPVL